MAASTPAPGPVPQPLTARRLNGERLTILGWSRAILLQMAHPLIATGVARHSTFRGGARQTAARMHGTIKAMLALTFGDEAQRDATLARIRGIHRTVRGTLARPAGRYEAGAPYSADDPELLLWVHATLLESITVVYDLVVEPLSSESRDRFCEESAPTLLALGGDPSRVPWNWRALGDYLADVHRSGALHITPEARAIAAAVLRPRISGVSFPGGSIHRLFTVGLLPPATREAYGFDWDRRQEKRLTRTIHLLRIGRRMAPAALARWSCAPRR